MVPSDVYGLNVSWDVYYAFLTTCCCFQVETSEKDMEVDTPPTAGQSHTSQKQSVLPEVEIFCYLLVTIFLIDQKQLDEVRLLYLEGLVSWTNGWCCMAFV